jgi:hypothetical protein
MTGPMQKPSIIRIISTDYLAALPATMLSLAWGLYLLNEITGFTDITVLTPLIGVEMQFFTFFAVVLTIFDLPLLIWRVLFIQNVFGRGLEIDGKVQETFFTFINGRIGYEYDFQNQNYSSGNAVRTSGRTKSYREDQQVILVVDPEKPHRAFIKDLYLG